MNDLKASPSSHLPFKIFGQKRKANPKKNKKAIFHSASMIAQVYLNFCDPDSIAGKRVKVQAPFGEIYNRGCRLNAEAGTYCKAISPNKNGLNHFQCDIFEFKQELKDVPSFTHTMIISHSCGIDNSRFVLGIPIFLESQLHDTAVVELKGSPSNNPQGALQGWFTNENVRFVGLPATDTLGDSERMLGCLNHVHSVDKSLLPKKPKLRLTYRALSYFQLRIAHYFFRDVQDSDESREL